jgi:Response regulator containing CheY-like receiver domain and AraC-type DNA-binding domain
LNEIHYMTPTTSDLKLPVYVTGAGHWDDQQKVDRPDGFPEYQWSQTVSGEGELRIGDSVYRIKPGEGFFLPPNLRHSYYATRAPWEVYWVTFDGHYTESLLKLSGVQAVGPYALEQAEPLRNVMEKLIAIARDKRPGHGSEGSKQLYGMLLDLRQQLSNAGASAHQMSERLQPVLQYMERHYSRTVTLGELARLIHVTPQHLCLLFKKTFHLRPMEYMNRTRVNKAKELMIRDKRAKLQEIALAVGFDNPAYFNTLFKGIAGMTPGEFRRRHGA